jgi:hypothetical protein
VGGLSIDLNIDERPHYVYVFWNGDECLYVGMTADPLGRLAAHRHSVHNAAATHVDVWSLGCDRREAERVEADAIRALDPLHNTFMSPRAEKRRADWAAYSEWANAYQRAWLYADCEWALDQATADRVCALVGYNAPNIAEREAQRRADMSRIAESLTSP